MPLTKKTRTVQADKGSSSLISKVKNVFSKDKVIDTTATVTTIDEFLGYSRPSAQQQQLQQPGSKLMT